MSATFEVSIRNSFTQCGHRYFLHLKSNELEYVIREGTGNWNHLMTGILPRIEPDAWNNAIEATDSHQHVGKVELDEYEMHHLSGCRV
jgi:hypothetical protein